MSNALYVRLAASTLRMLTTYGSAVTLRSYSGGTYNPATMAASPTVSNSSRMAVVIAYKSGDVLASGGLIQDSDRLCLMGAEGAAPTLSDRVVVGAVEYAIKAVKTIAPDGITPVLYELQLRA